MHTLLIVCVELTFNLDGTQVNGQEGTQDSVTLVCVNTAPAMDRRW